MSPFGKRGAAQKSKSQLDGDELASLIDLYSDEVEPISQRPKERTEGAAPHVKSRSKSSQS
jgi:hypothetical protein